MDVTELVQNLGILGQILNMVAIAMGVGLLFAGLFQLKRYGEMRTMMSAQLSIAAPLMTILASAMLLSLPTFLDTVLMSTMGYTSPMAYNTSGSGYSQVVEPILIFVRVIGVGSFIRGIILLSRSGDHQRSQPGMLGKAFTFMIGGVLCIHVQGTLHLLESILGLV
ncbi:MAG: hypothetical protein A3I77_06645 [Gammaproteobacteria bacterium RIFCSPLOWO2_02_FULL_42_14]|nr:MAG: hypothetical protein A3B71_02485 [Gammaproteobacteria bacterium RIFCSPHIGHO2_02_FULL_42_43]OGT51942.1 MAG: hypothetical protein A3E54_03985 [Gammaproteobacteria bacterium RIFCSPHIGHO2_12_FULL_41_25]OGT61047.1 MAG: hypothetical protein A3I77_06645 [Gammaproteobacteria bacterium RIFCSPLOWO2_02_FULL_42_14]OGT86974.1 MAG: hypothetical protein A3G86_00365 [Gammaproteobacteria bacterium RIFCSPLOWO2_12_FULL_42_18]